MSNFKLSPPASKSTQAFKNTSAGFSLALAADVGKKDKEAAKAFLSKIMNASPRALNEEYIFTSKHNTLYKNALAAAADLFTEARRVVDESALEAVLKMEAGLKELRSARRELEKFIDKASLTEDDKKICELELTDIDRYESNLAKAAWKLGVVLREDA